MRRGDDVKADDTCTCRSNPTPGCFTAFWPRNLQVFQGVVRCPCRCHEPSPPRPPAPLTPEERALLSSAGAALRSGGDLANVIELLKAQSTNDEIIASLAPILPQELAELVVINQVRLLRHPWLLEAIESNPNLSSDQRRRLAWLRETFRIEPPPRAN